ncbi:MAG: hypothetical protein QXI09_03595 [Candidatus Aenigmatarchaeota archaeon]
MTSKKILKKLTTFLVIMFLPVFNISLAEDGILPWVHTIGAWWLFFFVIGIAFIFASLIFGRISARLRKYLCIIGLVIILIGTFGAKAVYLIPFLGGEKTNFYTRCEGVSKNSIIETISCIFVGYAPTGFELYTLGTFIIFGVIAPLGILIALFYEVTRDIFTSSGVRNVVAFLSALIAFRTLLASMFLELLNYGFAGLGIMLINYLFFMIIFRVMQRTWAGSMVIEEILDYTTYNRIADLTAELRRINETLTVLSPGTPEYRYFSKRKEDLEKELKDLEKKVRGVPAAS